jgi:heme-degrading monooxygenase HmoA
LEVALMHARVLRLRGSAARVDDGIDMFKSRVAPALKEQDGYTGARLMVNHETGAGMSITFWRDEQTLHASDSALTSVRGEALSRFGAETPDSENYEAVVQHRPQPTESGNWVRVTSLQGDPAKLDQGIRHYESTVVPAVSRLTGFRGAVLFVDRATGKSLAATVWNTKQDLEASSNEVTSIRATAAEEIGATNPQVENYEVAFAELLSPVRS